MPDIVTLVVEAALLLGLAWTLAKLAGWLRLPPLLGMIVAGFVVGNLIALHLGHRPQLDTISAPVRLGVLAVVLLRAGLGLSRTDLRRAGLLAARLGSLPMLADAALVTVGGVLLLELPLAAALVLGFVVAAISPAIVIPGVIEILHDAPQEKRRVPTALLAGAPIDNILALVLLGVALDTALGASVSVGGSAVRILYAVGAGVAAGAAVGGAFALTCRRLSAFRGPLGTAIIWALAGGLVYVGKLLGFNVVLAVIALGAVVRAVAPEAALALAGGLAAIWKVVQYALFALIGAAVLVGPLATVGLASVAIIALGQLARGVGAWLATLRSGLTLRERAACWLAYIPKATIQAAFAGLPLDRGLAAGGVILTTGVLAIIVTAPLGVIALHRGARPLLVPTSIQREGQ